MFSVGPGLKGSVVERRRKEGSECAQRPLPVRCHSLLLASVRGGAGWDGMGWDGVDGLWRVFLCASGPLYLRLCLGLGSIF